MGNKELLEALEKDSNYKELVEYCKKVNFFEVTGMFGRETKHTTFLTWLLNSNETHGFGDKIVRAFLKKVYENEINNEKLSANIISLINDLDFYNFSVKGEKSERGNRYDITLTSYFNKKIIITIENKIDANESYEDGKYQTERYRNEIEKDKEKEEYNKFYIFLTPDGRPAMDVDYWYTASYRDIYEVINKLEEKGELNNNKECTIIKDYRDAIERNFIKCKYKKISKGLYKNNKKIIDLLIGGKIYDEDISSFKSDYNNRKVIDCLKNNDEPKAELPQTNKAVYDDFDKFVNNPENQKKYNIIPEKYLNDEYYVRFVTKGIREFFPKAPCASVHLKKYPYLYEISVDPIYKKLYLGLAVGVEENVKNSDIIKRIFNISKRYINEKVMNDYINTIFMEYIDEDGNTISYKKGDKDSTQTFSRWTRLFIFKFLDCKKPKLKDMKYEDIKDNLSLMLPKAFEEMLEYEKFVSAELKKQENNQKD